MKKVIVWLLIVVLLAGVVDRSAVSSGAELSEEELSQVEEDTTTEDDTSKDNNTESVTVTGRTYLSDFSLKKILTKTYGDAPFLLSTTTLPKDADAEVTYTSSDESILKINGNVATILRSGTVKVTASYPGVYAINIKGGAPSNPSYNITYSAGKLIIKAQSLITNPTEKDNTSSAISPKTGQELPIRTSLSIIAIIGTLILLRKKHPTE